MHIGLHKTIQDNETLFVNILLLHNLNVHRVTKWCHTHIFCHQMKVMLVCMSFINNTLNTGNKTAQTDIKRKHIEFLPNKMDMVDSHQQKKT